jgi:WD40 repeat protein
VQTIDSMPGGFDGEPWAADIHLSPDGRFLYSSERRSGTLAAFRVDAGDGTLALVGHVPTEAQPRGFDITPDGRFLVAAAQGSFLHGWRLADRQHFRMLGYQGRVDDWAWSPDGASLATAGAAAAIVWPFAGDDGPMTQSAVEVAPRAERTVTAVAWRPATRQLAVGYDDGAVRLASAAEPLAAQPVRAGGRSAITSIAWARGGDRLAFGSAAGECGAVAVDR